ncbi:hypothetical protein CEP54_016226 [Fusarium duplospermum]|uniref:Uncharacterized protein n=1 Tax=Fusarium duplospermum TaxID=1325734 RepID=A0A428NGP1_9HYPO|nr:hypothetical protein CEP54_016226 [Fusarium duplospermum]
MSEATDSLMPDTSSDFPDARDSCLISAMVPARAPSSSSRPCTSRGSAAQVYHPSGKGIQFFHVLPLPIIALQLCLEGLSFPLMELPLFFIKLPLSLVELSLPLVEL